MEIYNAQFYPVRDISLVEKATTPYTLHPFRDATCKIQHCIPTACCEKVDIFFLPSLHPYGMVTNFLYHYLNISKS